jgi:hypothetical protein
MTPSLYVDTSALAKWYLNEPASRRFEDYIRVQLTPPAVSTLTLLELRCLLGRRRRAGDIDSRNEQQAVAALERQIRVGLIEVFPLEDAHARAAIDLLAEKPQFALRTLDALHLALALALRVRTLATSDQLVAEAAGSLGLEVEVFL